MEKIILFLLQSTLASFICCLADRSVSGVPLFRARSFCFACKRTLKPYELIPLLSAPFLRFRCSSCQARFTGVWCWLFYEGIVPLLLAWVFAPDALSYWLCYPLLFYARQDQVLTRAATGYLWPLVLFLLLWPGLNQAGLLWPPVVFVLFSLLAARGWMGVGDLPIVVLGLLVWGKDFAAWVVLSSVAGLVMAGLARKRRIPFIPALLLGWLLLLLLI